MATPLLLALQQSRPQKETAVVASERVAAVFAPFRVRLFQYREGTLGILTLPWVLWRCWSFKADVFLGAQPANTLRHSLIAAISQARLRVKHAFPPTTEPERDLSCIYHHLLPLQPSRHRVEANLDLLRILGEHIPEGSLRPSYPVSNAAHPRVQQLFPRAQLVALHPGSGRAEKRWGDEQFIAVGRWLQAQGYTLVLLGGREEQGLARTLAQALGPATINMAGKTSVPETAAILSRCRLLVCNDSGLMHLAVAVGTPVVAIFVSTDPCHIGPYSPKAVVVGGDRGSRPTVEGVLQVLQQCLES
ncbi:MAG: glycosyltransferase family 9 protein [Candidatus Kapabacteria bacterium]|nr:glycosyltransferase family 9 protein [Candidatus Kapabacteria bacterium]MDW8011795.1 glycosyltransferase family 9 protein [Bacteroidota bacterium]